MPGKTWTNGNDAISCRPILALITQSSLGVMARNRPTGCGFATLQALPHRRLVSVSQRATRGAKPHPATAISQASGPPAPLSRWNDACGADRPLTCAATDGILALSIAGRRLFIPSHCTTAGTSLAHSVMPRRLSSAWQRSGRLRAALDCIDRTSYPASLASLLARARCHLGEATWRQNARTLVLTAIFTHSQGGGK